MLELQNISYMVDDDDKEILRDINLAFERSLLRLQDQTEVESPLLQRLSPAS